MLTKEAKALFKSKREQHSFRSSFTPPKPFKVSGDQLEDLKVKASVILTNIFLRISEISNNKTFCDTT